MKFRSIANILPATALSMGGTIVHQLLPTQRVDQIDPFLLLHHFGPYQVEPGGRDPLDLGPHPHRGFEPVTFLYKGGLRHRDSRNNTGYLKAGDVQWMTAGRGIIHSERASKEFIAAGGELEGIQLWVNLGPEHKMVQPQYQDIKSAAVPTVEISPGASLRVVAGEFGGVAGAVKSLSAVNAWQLALPAMTTVSLSIPERHNLAVYLLHGKISSGGGFVYDERVLLNYRKDGEAIELTGLADDSQLLILSGEPIGAPVASHGPFVMNNQTQIMEAMRDYQMGKMGFYVEE